MCSDSAGRVSAGRTTIDRVALVRRHNPEFHEWKPQSPLSVGNGDFAFTADFTGLQTCVGDPAGSVPRCTMSQHGFHSYPDAPESYEDQRLKEYDCGDRKVGYMSSEEGQEELYNGLRVNPHRFHLGRVGLYFRGTSEGAGESGGIPASRLLEKTAGIHQNLDLWSGLLESRFNYGGAPVAVKTVCHPTLPMVAVRIESILVGSGDLGLDLHFPYGSHTMEAADWSRDEAHSSELCETGEKSFAVEREMDNCRYTASLSFGGSEGIVTRRAGDHRWCFTSQEGADDGSGVLEFSILFTLDETAGDECSELPSFSSVNSAAAAHWKEFWMSGAAVSFEGSSAPGAMELERRVILSQYLLAIQSLGSLPPAETGLTCNSWYGKFHLEMHPWHSLHGLIWGRGDMVRQSLPWYKEVLEGARKRAESQGYSGVRWPKMTDPSGNDSPSPIGCLLCWQQPHMILFAELLYRSDPSEALLAEYGELLYQTAEFMADYPLWDEDTGRYVLGPPLIPAQENHAPEDTLNPMFELEYWRWALKTAAQWQRRRGESVPEKWNLVLEGLSPCPVDPGNPERYAAHELCADSFGQYGTDHPSMLLAYGFLPPQTADPQIVSNTVDAVFENWDQRSMWGWDFPSLAMTLARLGRRKEAVEALLMESPKNLYMENGHNRQEGHDALPLYLPGNGALLLAVGMMAGGWDGCESQDGSDAPGFPDDGSWIVHCEGMDRYI
ncbi:MAG: hypothetical protein PQJ50_10535 [Spirochaetales bacterium]|nr:hypothetical protein [Spirochaetales bacterium]